MAGAIRSAVDWLRSWRWLAMAGGRFEQGDDSRRYRGGRVPKAAKLVRKELRKDRAGAAQRLVELSEQDEDLRVALEATKTRIIITDGPLEAQHAKDKDAEGKPATGE